MSSKVFCTEASDLHRLDFRIEGKSCPSCLLAIERKIRAMPGVKEAVVMLKRPFGASVVYQANEIKSRDIIAAINNKDGSVKILELNDQAITNEPSLLIPPFVPCDERQGTKSN